MSLARYLVKFDRAGKTVYGTVDDYSQAAKSAAARGLRLVNDATRPVCYEVHDAQLTDIEFALPRYDAQGSLLEGDEFQQHVHTEYEAARKASDAIASGVGVGSMFKIGVGDGYAFYVVVKVNKKTCKVEWRGFCMDRWHDHHFGIGGTFPLSDVARYVEGERTINRLFARKP